MLQLRDYQSNGVGNIREAFRNDFKAPLYVLPTGGGKTVCFAWMAKQSADRGKKVLILVHRIELLRQTCAALERSDVDHGIINPNFRTNMMVNVQVASVQTLINRMERYPFVPDLIIIDECHHANAGTWRRVFDYYSNALLLGVTATPIRNDGSGLGIGAGGFFDYLILGPQIKELIAAKHLVPPIVYTPLDHLDIASVKIDSDTNDFNKDQLAEQMDKPRITGNAVAEYRKICPGVPTVVFCITVKHAERVAKQFREAGYRFYAVDGKMDDDERRNILEGLGDGRVQGVVSCDLISEGFDIPAIMCVIQLRPTTSTGLYLQQVGRGARTSPGKTHFYLLDHAGNVIRHGMPDEDRTWSLEGERKQKRLSPRKSRRSVKPKICEKCNMMHAPARECPGCGHIYGLVDETVININGRLTQVTEQAAALIKQQRIKEVATAKTLWELEAIAKQRGYKKSWAMNIFEARQKKNNKV